jgi:hypothetical protein
MPARQLACVADPTLQKFELQSFCAPRRAVESCTYKWTWYQLHLVVVLTSWPRLWTSWLQPFLTLSVPFPGHPPPLPGAEGDLKLVHPRIAAPVAEALGVASRRRLLLAASADCLSLGLAGAGGAVEAFGQSEALTTRLRHIIQVGPRVRMGFMLCRFVSSYTSFDSRVHCHLANKWCSMFQCVLPQSAGSQRTWLLVTLSRGGLALLAGPS